eukprot:2154692-Pyramimonas_sp.AAC.3
MALPESAIRTGEHKKVFGLTGGHHEDLTFTLQVRVEIFDSLSSVRLNFHTMPCRRLELSSRVSSHHQLARATL